MRTVLLTDQLHEEIVKTVVVWGTNTAVLLLLSYSVIEYIMITDLE